MVDFKKALAKKRAIAKAKETGAWDTSAAAAPFYDPERDGVTFSLLSGWMACKEMARLNLSGVTSKATSMALVFGTIVHAALELMYEMARDKEVVGAPTKPQVDGVVHSLEALYKEENPRASQETLQHLEFSLLLAESVLPAYFKYWKMDFTEVQWVLVEQEFRIPVTVRLHNGRTVRTFLRGKIDGAFLYKGRLYLFETKTKTRIDEATLSELLPHEMQVMIYLWALRRLAEAKPHGIPAGVRYNLVRRPALRQKASESLKQFAVRCAEDIRTRPDFYFMRMDMDVTLADLNAFEGELTDILSDFLSWRYGVTGHYKNSRECENKYGTCAMLPLCGPSKNTTLFYQRKTVFRELEDK